MAMPNFNEEVRKFMNDVCFKGRRHYQYVPQAAPKWGRRAKKFGQPLAETAVTSAVGSAVAATGASVKVATGVGVQVLGHTVGGTVNPLTWVARPWLAARDVAVIQWDLEKVYAIMDEDGGVYRRKYNCEETYPCTCGDRQKQAFVVWTTAEKKAYYGSGTRDADHKDCKAVRDFLVAQKEAKVIKIAINATLVGVPFYMAYAAARSIYKRAAGTIHQDRAQAAQHLVRDALPALTMDDQMRVDIVEPGCQRAQALIALLCGELNLKTPNSNAANYPRTMAALTHPDGWEMIATALSAAVIKDAGSGKALRAPAR